jgi:hypothetical protein
MVLVRSATPQAIEVRALFMKYLRRGEPDHYFSWLVVDLFPILIRLFVIESPWLYFRDSYENGTMPKQYPRDFRRRAIRLVTESRDDHETEWSAIRQVATRLDVGPETS